MKYYLLSITVILLFSCSQPSELNPEKDSIEENSSTDNYSDLRDYPSVALEENIDALIVGMTRDNCVYPKEAGIAGEYTYEYACFERLTQLITEKEIYNLIEHPNANVRLYAYYHLDDTRSTYLDSARIKLQEDNSRVWTLKESSKEHIKLSDLVKIKPIDKLKSSVNYDENITAESRKK